MILGDSVMHDASYGITAALEATGEATVATKTIDGFGLVPSSNWPTSIPNLIKQTGAQLIVASWSWDQFGPTTPNALHQPAQYTKLLRRAVATMLAPGNGVEGVIFTEFPQSGDIPAANPADQAGYNRERRAGVTAWNDIAEKMTSYFPGRVMYFPLAGSVLLARQGIGVAPARGRPARTEQRLAPRPQARQRAPLPRGQRPLCRRPADRHDIGVPSGARRDRTGPRGPGRRIRTSTTHPGPARTTTPPVAGLVPPGAGRTRDGAFTVAADLALAQLVPMLATTS